MILVVVLQFESEIDLNRWVPMIKKCYLSGFAIRLVIVIAKSKLFLWSWSWSWGPSGHLVIMIIENELILWSWSVVVKEIFEKANCDNKKWTKFMIMVTDFCNLFVWAKTPCDRNCRKWIDFMIMIDNCKRYVWKGWL